MLGSMTALALGSYRCAPSPLHASCHFEAAAFCAASANPVLRVERSLLRALRTRAPPRRQRQLAERPTQRRRCCRVSAVLERSGFGENMFEEFDENDKEFIAASLLPATEVRSGSQGFLVKLADGRVLRCTHNQSHGAALPDYPAQPAMVLKMEDGSGVLLPLIVLEGPKATLLEAMRNVPLSRPTVYLVIRDMIELMGYELKLVRITHRVCEAYFARIYVAKVGDDSGNVLSLDLRPSDAINIAVRAKVPIQVRRVLAVSDGIRQVSMPPPAGGHAVGSRSNCHFLWTDEDRADAQDATAAAEFGLVRLMEMAALEERFADAAKIRDQLKEFRARVVVDFEE